MIQYANHQIVPYLFPCDLITETYSSVRPLVRLNDTKVATASALQWNTQLRSKTKVVTHPKVEICMSDVIPIKKGIADEISLARRK